MRSSQFNIISFSCNFLFTEKAKEWIDPGPSPLYKIKSIVHKISPSRGTNYILLQHFLSFVVESITNHKASDGLPRTYVAADF